jgi:hypothetical protein
LKVMGTSAFAQRSDSSATPRSGATSTAVPTPSRCHVIDAVWYAGTVHMIRW